MAKSFGVSSVGLICSFNPNTAAVLARTNFHSLSLFFLSSSLSSSSLSFFFYRHSFYHHLLTSQSTRPSLDLRSPWARLCVFTLSRVLVVAIMSGLSAEYLTNDEYAQRQSTYFFTYIAATFMSLFTILWLLSRTLKSFNKDHSNILPTTSTTEKETKKSTRNRLWQ